MKTSFTSHSFIFLGCLFILLVSKPLSLLAQISGSDTSFQSQFKAFNSNINKEFNTFRQYNDSVFLKFLSQSWKEFSPVQNKIPTLPKPINPPVYKTPENQPSPKTDSVAPESSYKQNEKPLPNQNKPDSLDKPEPEKKEFQEEDESFQKKSNPAPEPGILSNAGSLAEIAFYGTNFNVPEVAPGLPVLSSVTKENIAVFFDAASGSSLLNDAARTIKKEASNFKLNDWGLANLLMKAAQEIYPRYNDQVMFTWFALLRSGFNVKIGYDKQNVFLLLPSNEMLYETSYTVNGRAYYLLNFDKAQVEPESLRIHEADYPQSKAGLSFMITQTPDFTNLLTQRSLAFNPALELKVNKNLIDFYGNYPQCELKVFFDAPLSENAACQIDAYFIPVLKTKNDDERVAYLLNFVQQAIRYQTDVQQFGHEKYLFADETLYYPAADCEDRSIFLAKLINRYTNCSVIGLSYPTHVSLAVNLTSLPDGKYFLYKNLRYYHCDPTYIGAGCGVPMPEFENLIPKIIDFAFN